MTERIVIEIMDGTDGELIGYGVAEVITSRIPGGTQTDYRLLPDVYGTRSEAWTATDTRNAPTHWHRESLGDPSDPQSS